MTTAARQRRILSSIERTLRRTDPRLASKFGMFSQLAQDEPMPPAEQTTSRPAGWRSWMPRIGNCHAASARPSASRPVIGVAAAARAAPGTPPGCAEPEGRLLCAQ